MSINDQLAEYLEARDAARAEEVRKVLAAMTKRERQLVWEVAVMAGVHGRLAGGVRETPPKDSTVVYNAILGCLYMPDLYPTFQRLKRIAVRRARKVQDQS